MAEVPEVFRTGGAVGEDLARVDWSATPLGPPATWPRALTAVVQVVLSSRFSMWMAWGEDLTFFCNDAYRRDTLGRKYPWALGRPAREVWAEIWPDIGPRIATVTTTGEATWDEGLLLFLQRSGYVEETYHTFSYSPLRDDDDRIAGMLCVVSEDTERVVGERHLTTLGALGSALAAARTEPEVLAAATAALAEDQRSLPFALIYLSADGSAVLAAASGAEAGSALAPAVVRPGDGSAWPLEELHAGRAVLVDLAAAGLDPAAVPRGAWPDPPAQAWAVPLRQQADAAPSGFLVAGLNPHRPFDDAYRAFVELVAGQVAAGITTARAYEAERHRAERLAELDRVKTAFFANVSHEFRTPLTLLLGPAEDALRPGGPPLPDVHRARFEVVQRNGQRLLKLVNDLLDFSRLESGGLAARFEPVALEREVAELAGAFAEAVHRAGLTLDVDCEPPGEPVWIDRDLFAKVVLNLLSNALKFTHAGGIAVALRRDGDAAELTVADTGVGIAPEDQGGVFDRFSRVAGVRSRTHEGSGIGLALVAELVALHGGTVAVDSAPGRGSTFAVRLPLGTAHLPAQQLAADPATAGGAVGGDGLTAQRAAAFVSEAHRWQAPAPAVAPGGVADGRARVLVVDDNADMRDYVAGLLAPDHAVSTADDGEEALAAVRREVPDLVLTDVMMPRLDGFGLLAALRADPATARVPVVMLSARAGEEATVEGLEAGADDYLVKPFSALELRARVRANLELDRVRRMRDELQRRQELLDQAQRLARVGSWEIDLASGALSGSAEFLRQMGLDGRVRLDDPDASPKARVHPDDVPVVDAALAAAAQGEPLDYEVRVLDLDGRERRFHSLGTLQRAADGTPLRLVGSNQDVTEQRRAEEALASAAAAREVAARERSIADELQRSLLPQVPAAPDHLRVATLYRAGVQGTQVGGDWYDVVELGAGRTALVLGDVMGRGVRAAAVMGQLRAAVRAYARLDLPPADLLELLDGVVRDLGEDQIVTCVYAVFDPWARTLTWANAGHLPPLVRLPDGEVQRLDALGGPPLGAAGGVLAEHEVPLPPGSLLLLYTDGLVERRDSDLDTGVDALAAALGEVDGVAVDAPQRLLGAMLPEGADDDIAVLLAQVDPDGTAPPAAGLPLEDERSVREARTFLRRVLAGWGVPRASADDLELLASELVTNAVVHGSTPAELRLRRTPGRVALEVSDSASQVPRRQRPGDDEEHGRGLLLVSSLSEQWGIRPTRRGKAVWCEVPVPEETRA